jgi:hypothetical protein
MEEAGHEPRAAAILRSRERFWNGGCVALYLVLCLTTAWVWEPEHDEGMTWSQAFGRVTIPGFSPLSDEFERNPKRQLGVTVASLYAIVGAHDPHDSAQVIDALLQLGGMHPPAYYLMLNLWAGWFGTERIPLNLPAYLAGVCSLFGIRRLATALCGGPPAGRMAMLLMACSPWFLGFSTLARPYGLAVCAAIWSSVALLAIHSPAGRFELRWRVGFVLLSLLGVYSIYHYLFVFAWQAGICSLLALRAGRKAWLPTAGMLAAVGAGYAPWVPSLLVHLDATGSHGWYFRGAIAAEHWGPLVIRSLRLYLLGESVGAVGAPALRIGALVLGLAALPLAVRSFRAVDRRALGPVELLWWTTAPLLPAAVIAADVVHGSHTIFLTRLCFFLFPILLLLFVRAWQCAPRWLGTTGVSASAVLLLTATLLGLYTRASSLTAYEAVARELAAADSPSHLVVLSSLQTGYVVPFLLSLRSAGLRELRIAYAPGERVYDLVDLEVRRGSAERVSLVNLEVIYARHEMWNAGLLRRVRRRASIAGWKLVGWRPGSEPPEAGAAPRGPGVRPRHPDAGSLWIISPTPVKYFNMEELGFPLRHRERDSWLLSGRGG